MNKLFLLSENKKNLNFKKSWISKPKNLFQIKNLKIPFWNRKQNFKEFLNLEKIFLNFLALPTPTSNFLQAVLDRDLMIKFIYHLHNNYSLNNFQFWLEAENFKFLSSFDAIEESKRIYTKYLIGGSKIVRKIQKTFPLENFHLNCVEKSFFFLKEICYNKFCLFLKNLEDYNLLNELVNRMHNPQR